MLGMCTSTKNKRIKRHDEIKDLIIKKLSKHYAVFKEPAVAQTRFGYKKSKYGLHRRRDGQVRRQG